MSDQLTEAASWRIVAEFFRRYPSMFQVIETHPCSGQYDCLSLISRDHEHIADFNRHGSFHVFKPFDGVHREPMSLWKRMLEGEDMKRILDDVCAHLGLPLPKALPPSTPEVLSYRFIAALLAHAVFGRDSWRCCNGFHDTSGMEGSSHQEYFELFPEANEKLRVQNSMGILGHPAYRFWFLLKNSCPVLCLDCSGMVWLPKGKSYDLPTIYKKEHRIWPLVFHVAGHLLP